MHSGIFASIMLDEIFWHRIDVGSIVLDDEKQWALKELAISPCHGSYSIKLLSQKKKLVQIHPNHNHNRKPSRIKRYFRTVNGIFICSNFVITGV